MKAHCTIIATVLAAALSANAKTFDWPIDSPTAGARQFTAYHGETVRFNLQFKGAMTNLAPVCIYYQTNGMGNAEWFEPIPGTVFHPTNDCGAAFYRFFIRCTDPDGVNYSANGSLRMLDSPGFEPSTVQLPVRTLDFSRIEVLNPPWPTADDLADATNKTLQAAKDYADDAKSSVEGVTPEMVTNIVNDVAPAPGNYAIVSNAAMNAVQQSGYNYSRVYFGPTDPIPGTFSWIDWHGMSASFGESNTKYLCERIENDGATLHLPMTSGTLALTSQIPSSAADIGAASSNDLAAAAQNASDALAYSRATYDFQQGNTNAWFSGTNYVFGADATNKTTFAFEPGMDLATMPCSLALMELRDGTTQNVWDQRDWTVWYWNFKNAQQEASISARFAAAAEFNATNYAPIAWGRRTSSGLANPDQKTLWVDAEKTVLAPGMAWESTVEVSGCAYWTIVGSATLSGTTNGVITIKDFEGEPVFSIKKTSSRLVYLECGSEIYTHGSDSQGRITFTMRSSVQPVGEFSTVLDDSLFVSEDDAGCPVDYEWETVSSGVYRIHFLLKPGIVSDACFAKFKVEIQGETAVEFSAPQKITGGIIYNDGVHGDVKIRPVITSTAVGSVVTWEVAP